MLQSNQVKIKTMNFDVMIYQQRLSESKYSIESIGSYLATVTSFKNIDIIQWLLKEENQDKRTYKCGDVTK